MFKTCNFCNFKFRFPNFDYTEELNVKKLPLQKSDYWSVLAYNQSKLCNILFSMELNRRLASQGVTSNAVHPGNMIYTSLAKNSWFYWMLYVMCRPFSKSAVSCTSVGKNFIPLFCCRSPPRPIYEQNNTSTPASSAHVPATSTHR